MLRNQTKYFFIILIITSLACAVPSFSVPESTVINTETSFPIFTETRFPTTLPTFTFTPTLIRPTRAITETFTPSPIFTLDINTATITTTSFPTSTIELTSISVSKPTNCRVGPGKDYEIAGTLLVGETATVLGRDPSSQYWYIPNPDPGFEYCWVWGEYATLTGNALALPIFTPLPTPTSTSTPLPSLKFTAFGRGMDKCTDSWWVDLEITNNSKLTLRSVRVEMLDRDTNVTKFNSSDGFINRDGCSSYFQTETIEPEKSYVISGPVFNYNPHTHILRVFVTVCTEKDQKGICNTIKIAVKP